MIQLLYVKKPYNDSDIDDYIYWEVELKPPQNVVSREVTGLRKN